MKNFRSLALALICLVVYSCDAPRINPLDALNPDSNLGQIDGYVLLVDGAKAQGVKVYWKTQNAFTITDTAGYFRISNLQLNNGYIYFEKSELNSDSVQVQWNNAKSKRVNTVTLGYKYSQVYGLVKTNSAPQKALAGVTVFWKNQNITTLTDQNGNYSFPNLSQKSGMLYFSLPGYSNDSAAVTLSNQKSVRVADVALNSIPKIGNVLFYTVVQNLYPADQKDSLFIKVQISDPDNDIDSVTDTCSDLRFSRQLFKNSATGYYENKFSETDLNLSSLDEGIGKNFDILVKDVKKRVFTIGTATIKRLITQEVLPQIPLNKQIVGSTPTLQWFRLLPGFNFTYTIQVFTDVPKPVLVWQKKSISKDDIQATIDAALPSGEYFWVIWCVDDFQNSSRSKPASFIVK